MNNGNQSDDNKIAEKLRALALHLLHQRHGKDVNAWPDHARAQHRELVGYQVDGKAVDQKDGLAGPGHNTAEDQ